MGYFGAGINMGFVIGPAIGGLLAQPELGLAGFRPPIFVAAAFCALSALWCALVLQGLADSPGTVRRAPDWSEAFRFVGANPLLTRLFALAFIGIGAFASMEAVFGLWTQANFGWSTHEVGLTFIAVGATGLTIQLFLIGPLSRRYGEARVIVLGMVVLGLSMILQPILKLPIAAVVLMSTLMGGHSLAFPERGVADLALDAAVRARAACSAFKWRPPRSRESWYRRSSASSILRSLRMHPISCAPS